MLSRLPWRKPHESNADSGNNLCLCYKMRTCWRGPSALASGTPNPGLEWSVVRPLVGFLAGSKKTNAIKAKELELNVVKRGMVGRGEGRVS